MIRAYADAQYHELEIPSMCEMEPSTVRQPFVPLLAANMNQFQMDQLRMTTTGQVAFG
jgi:hypothetical protein